MYTFLPFATGFPTYRVYIRYIYLAHLNPHILPMPPPHPACLLNDLVYPFMFPVYCTGLGKQHIEMQGHLIGPYIFGAYMHEQRTIY